MAAVRPLVLLYQEYAGVSGAEETPTLDTLTMGPCYHIQDFPQDRRDIAISPYNVETAPNDATGSAARPSAGTDAIVLADAPGNIVGAQLDHSSVVVHMEDVLAELVAGDSGVFATAAPDEDKFTAPGALDLGDAGVRPGDRLVVTTTASDTYVMEVREVGGLSGSTLSTDTVQVTSNFTDANATDLLWRFERRVSSDILPEDFLNFDENIIEIKGGVTLPVPVNGSDEMLPVNYAKLYVAYRALRTDLATVTTINENNQSDILGRVDERNPLAVGAFVALQNTTTSLQVFGIAGDNLNGAQDIVTAYAQAALQLESRDDTYAMIPLTRDPAVINALHQHAIKFSDPERARFREVIANLNKLPLTKTVDGPSIAGTAEKVSTDPVSVFYLHDAGISGAGPLDMVRAGDDLYIPGNGGTITGGKYPIESVLTGRSVYAPTLDADFTDGDSESFNFYVLRGAGARVTTLTGAETTAINEITVPPAQASTDHVGHIIRLKDAVTNATTSPVGNSDFIVQAVNDTTGVYTVNGPDIAVGETLAADIIEPLTDITYTDATTLEGNVRQPYRRILDNNAGFVSNGVVPGDLLEVPLPALSGGADYSDSTYQSTIAEVQSENRITLVEGTEVPVTNGETGQTGDLGYRVIRMLDKEGQKDEIIQLVNPQTGYNSKRLVLVWPDEVLLSGVENASTETRSRQPGYYLCCAVGGMSAGLPPHQGFTFLGISGVEAVYHSTRYFSEDALEEISNAGFYLFVQDTDSSAPYCLHQLTTDTSDTRTMELSIVRNFDFVSRFYRRIMERFIGRYNVTPQTLDVLRESLNNGTDQLRGQSLPRIDAPILSATVTRVEPLEGQRDRVEVYMDLELPTPLNRIGLRLRA